MKVVLVVVGLTRGLSLSLSPTLSPCPCSSPKQEMSGLTASLQHLVLVAAAFEVRDREAEESACVSSFPRAAKLSLQRGSKSRASAFSPWKPPMALRGVTPAHAPTPPVYTSVKDLPALQALSNPAGTWFCNPALQVSARQGSAWEHATAAAPLQEEEEEGQGLDDDELFTHSEESDEAYDFFDEGGTRKRRRRAGEGSRSPGISSGDAARQCARCGVRRTPTWRFVHDCCLCNACGLYVRRAGKAALYDGGARVSTHKGRPKKYD